MFFFNLFYESICFFIKFVPYTYHIIKLVSQINLKMKLRLILILAGLMLSGMCLAEDVKDSEHVTMKNGEMTMTVDVAQGGKILSLKYLDREVLSQLRWPESFGSTFWTSPQKEWNWPPVPEFDKAAYSVSERSESRLVIESKVSVQLGYSVGKAFAVDVSDGAFVITYSVRNESSEPRRVAPWEITRVVNADGIVFFEAVNDSVWPGGLMAFNSDEGAVWYRSDEASENRKVNADGRGWLAYCADGLLLVKRFQDLQPAEPAPGEAEVQVYVNRGKTYIELESQGAYTLLQPGSKLDWTVRWYLRPVDAKQQSLGELIKMVKTIIN